MRTPPSREAVARAVPLPREDLLMHSPAPLHALVADARGAQRLLVTARV